MNKTPVILSAIIFIVTFPLCLCMYIILRLLSCTFYLIAKIQYGSKVFRPSTMDVLAGMGSEISRPYYNVVFSLEGQRADIDTIRRHYKEKLFHNGHKQQNEAAKKWRSYLKTYCGYYVWRIDDQFDVRNHIRMVDPREIMNEQIIETVNEMNDQRLLSEKGKVDLGDMSWEEIVQHLVTSYGSREIYNMPKWELLVMEETENRYTCLFRVNHSICDGLHFGKMMTKLICDQETHPIKMPMRRNPSSSFFSRVALAVRSFCLLPYGIWAGLVYKDENPLYGKELSGRKNYYVSKPVPISKLTEIRKHLKVTINDIVFSCVSKAVTSHFEHISKNVTEVTSLLPIGKISNDEDMKMKNDIFLSSVKLPTSEVNDSSPDYSFQKLASFCETESEKIKDFKSIRRLAIVQSNLNEAKNNPTMMSVCWFLMTISSHLPAWLANAIISMDGLTLNVSNIRGPEGDHWSIAKSSLKDLIFLLNDKDPLGLAISVLSFRGAIRFGMILDDALMTKIEGQNFINDILVEMNNLRNEADMLRELKKSD